MKPDFLDNVEADDIQQSPQDDATLEFPYHILIEGWTEKNYDRSIEPLSSVALFCDNSSFNKNNPTKTRPYLFIADYAFDSIKDKRKVNDSIFALFKQILYSTKADQITASLVCRKDSKYTILHQERVSLRDLQVSGKLNPVEDKRNIEIIKSFSSAIKAIEDAGYCEDNSLCDKVEDCRQKYENDKVKNKEYLTIRQHSSKGIPTDIITLMEKVVKTGRSRFLTLFDNLLPYHFNDPLPIPIYLLDPSDMPTYRELWNDIKDVEKYIPKYEVLGYYIRKDKLCNEPHIVLSPENIEACAGHYISLGNLFTYVLVHEISHSVLDKYYEYKLYSDLFPDWNLEIIKVTENQPQSKCARAMEESLANMMTLQWIESTGDNKLINETMSFIKNQQPAFYQFGINQYDTGVDWRMWRAYTKQETAKLQEWYNICFVDGIDTTVRIPLRRFLRILLLL